MADVDVKLPPFERLAMDFQTLVPKVVFQESVRSFVKIRSFHLFQLKKVHFQLLFFNYHCSRPCYSIGSASGSVF